MTWLSSALRIVWFILLFKHNHWRRQEHMPLEIHDNVFGFLKQDGAEPEYYDASVDFTSDETVHLRLDMQFVKDEDFPTVLKRTHQTYFALQAKKDVFCQAIADEFLPR